MAKQIKDENGNVYVQKKKFYKRWWFWLLVVLVVVFLGSGAFQLVPEAGIEPATNGL